MNCDNCDTVFESLGEAQSHYILKHEIARGYIKCCDIKLREDQVVKEHIAYHLDPDAYESVVVSDLKNSRFNFIATNYSDIWFIFQMFRVWRFHQNEITIPDPLEKPYNHAIEPNIHM